MNATINDARWQEWADKFLAAPVEDPGRQKTAEIMGFFLARREATDEELVQLEHDFNDSFMYTVLKSHAARIGLNLDEEGRQFIALISEDLGSVVMHVHAARRLQQKLGVEQLGMQDFFQTAFEYGLRTEAILHELWDEQKLSAEEMQALREGRAGGGVMDNYLDHVTNA